MLLRHILVAVDASDAGSQAIRIATALASGASARVTLVRVSADHALHHLVGAGHHRTASYQEGNLEAAPERAAAAEALLPAGIPTTEVSLASGIPGIEICRVAEQVRADLVILGWQPHFHAPPLVFGDTAEAVVRRSRAPCLCVAPGAGPLRRVLVALDGSDRGMSVLYQACDFARYAGAALEAVTVERRPRDEALQLVPTLPVARSASLEERVRLQLAREGFPAAPLKIRRGDIVDRVIAEAQECEASVLAIGYHRGGSARLFEAAGTAWRLAQAAPCAVLTIPL